MKTLGLIGGMSWESTVPYYRIINETVRERPAILILAISPVLDYGGAGSRGGEGSSRTGTTRPGSKLWSMNVIKASQFSKHR
jgi:hypothetical protein